MAIFRREVMAQKIGYANFGAFAAELMRLSGYDGSSENPHVRPEYQLSRQEQLQRLLGVDWYYGGWMEDRSIVWSDTYLKETGNFLHLGIDCSVRAGTEVLAVRDGPVVLVGNDAEFVGGWGGYVIQRIEYRGQPHALIYAHLGTLLCVPKQHLVAGSTIGMVGNKHENGHWGEHLHVQLWSGIEGVTDWRAFFSEQDGYGNVAHIDTWAKRCPDPTPLVF